MIINNDNYNNLEIPNSLKKIIESVGNTQAENTRYIKVLRSLPLGLKSLASFIILVLTMSFCLFLLYILFINPTFSKINYLFTLDDNKTPKPILNIQMYNTIWLTTMMFLTVGLIYHYMWHVNQIQDVVNEFHLVSFFVLVFYGQLFIPVIMYYLDNMKLMFYFSLLMAGLSFQIVFFLVSEINYPTTIFYATTLLYQIFNLAIISEKL